MGSSFNSTGVGPAFFLGTAIGNWSVQVITPSTAAVVTLKGFMAPTSSGTDFVLGTIGTVLISTSTVAGSTGNASGDVVSFAGRPVTGVLAQLDSASSSGVYVYITGV